MPYNVWCTGCRHMIARGVRFNAEKKAVGKYHTTTIWAFKMRTPCCSTELEIRTDPKASDYLIVTGAERKTVTFSAADAGTAELGDPAERAAARADAFGALEAAVGDAAAGRAAAPTLAALIDRSRAVAADDYSANKVLRRAHRTLRRETAVDRLSSPAARAVPAHIPLLRATEEDIATAAGVAFGPREGGFVATHRDKRRAIRAASLMAPLSGEKRAAAELAEKRRKLEAGGVRFGSGAPASAAPGGFGAAPPLRRRP